MNVTIVTVRQTTGPDLLGGADYRARVFVSHAATRRACREEAEALRTMGYRPVAAHSPERGGWVIELAAAF